MLVIRLQRTGRKNLATYRIVVAEKARAVKGRFLEILGHYLPMQKTAVFSCDQERVTHWIQKGAIPSDTLARLLRKEGMKGMDRYIQRYTKRKSKNAPEEAAAPAAPVAPAQPAEEAAPQPAEAETPPAEA